MKGFYYDHQSEECQPICGDGLKISPEECDDSNLVIGDGCDNTCHIEEGYDENLVLQTPLSFSIIDINLINEIVRVRFSSMVTQTYPIAESSISIEIEGPELEYEYKSELLNIPENIKTEFFEFEVKLTDFK